ncbi:MAG: PD-(D/E)XK nuclease family protein, partial [Solirubrobacteraceae bacterium]
AGLSPPVGPAEADELIALVRRFAAGELCARLGRARDAAREQRFAFTLASDPGAPLLVGVIDVLARESAGRALVVDYKSDRLAGAAPAEVVQSAYVAQRLIYALAALRSGAHEVEVVHCFLQEPEQPVSETFERADTTALGERLQELAQGVRSGHYPVSDSPCAALCGGCPARGGLCSWPLELTRRRSPDTLF